jgi:hypothetical protein
MGYIIHKIWKKSSDFPAFEEYRKAKWDMKRAHAYRLIDGAKVLVNLSPIGDKI